MLSEGKPGGIFESPLSDNPYAASANTTEFPTGSGGDATTRFARSYAVNWDAGKNELGAAKAGQAWYDDTASIWPYMVNGTNQAGSGVMTTLQNPAGTVMINSTRTQFAFTYAGEIIYGCDTAYCGPIGSNKTRIFSVGAGLMNLGFFDGHAKAIKGKKAIADDLFDIYTTWWTQPSGFYSKADVLQRLNSFPEWQ
jgi:prepilin-type processing-associated H-X9-DG protein